MFGFIGKFKTEVINGFDAVHQRLVTLEAKVEALFEHTKTVAQQDAVKMDSAVKNVETGVAQVVGDVPATSETVATEPTKE